MADKLSEFVAAFEDLLRVSDSAHSTGNVHGVPLDRFDDTVQEVKVNRVDAMAANTRYLSGHLRFGGYTLNLFSQHFVVAGYEAADELEPVDPAVI